ncbi:hypothetical protein JTB14_009889 [Gonioctena quinquepunctata]|nr:hypothetical protein JTB14_009889 [Gonioctena quinquepunctata]
MQRKSVEDPKEFPTDFWDNTTFSGLADELAKPKTEDLEEAILNNEYKDHPDYIDDLWANNAESKTKTVKCEDDIDIIDEDVKPEICEGKPDLFIGTDTEANFSHELSTGPGTQLQQNTATKKNETSMIGENYRMEPTVEKPFQCKDQEATELKPLNIRKNTTKVNHNNGVILKNEVEDHHEYIDDLSTNNAESKTKTLKTKDDIDILYEDVEPELYEDKPDLITETEIGEDFLHELSIESGTLLQQNTTIEENDEATYEKIDVLQHPISYPNFPRENNPQRDEGNLRNYNT